MSKPEDLYEIEIDGEMFGVGIAPGACLPPEPEDYLDPSEIDPEAWRKYADLLDAKQIDWLFRNPDYLSRDVADILRRHPSGLTPGQLKWLEEHPDWDGDGE